MDNVKYSLPIFLLLLQVAYAAGFRNISTVPFSKGFSPLFGEANIISSSDDLSVQLHLNRFTGSGFQSSDLYNHGFFSAKIKLPSYYTAGVVVAFYTTNGDIFRKTHDELDFEFLGNIRGKRWRFQTNMYGNGSTDRGREERYYLWFDPSKEFHTYTIVWTTKNIIFYVDDIPVREITRNDAMGADFPSKPMKLYSTIWDASDWATSGGKYRADYKYAPFVAEFTDLVLHGCTTNILEEVVATGYALGDDPLATGNFGSITPKQKLAMKKFRSKYMYYSYCYDTLRYPVALPECVIDPALRERFMDTGRPKLIDRHYGRRYRKRNQVMGARKYGNQEGV
ncbi:putative xyloglucan endotransglucosylase/hydrolase protein 30 [Orobanche hederae]